MTKAVILFFILLPFSCLAQFSISGRIVNKTDGKTVPGAGIFLINASTKTSTAADGTFTLPNLAPGKYSLAISAPGFQVANKDVTVGNGNINVGDIPILSKAVRDEKLKEDSDVAKTIVAGLKKFNTQHISEKVYLHFDKPYYAAGDTIFFKAYLTVGQGHHLSALSGILYVDLINGAKQITQSERLEVIGGVAWGDFTLPDTVSTSTYRVRAYTNWMRNDGEQSFFDQAIPVGAVTTKVASVAGNKVQQPEINEDIQFFAEGGSLATGIKSKIAFKAIDSTGFGVQVKGSIVDKENNEVATFNSTHLGMGCFYLKPLAGEIYKAKVTYPDGKQLETNLPVATDNGVVLSVKNDTTSKTTITIKTGGSFYTENRGKNFTVVIYASGKVIFFNFTLDDPGVGIDFSKTGLTTGVASVTLFSPSGEPLNERLFFIKNPAGLKVDLSSDKISYSKREKATITLKTTGVDGSPVQGHFSAAVIDESRVPVDEDAENTIFSYLLLTSELKGYVEQPNYYFASDSSKRTEDLDLLMLTQGYRSFEWKQVLEDKMPALAYNPETSLELTGTLKTPAGKPVPNGSIVLIASKQKIFTDTTADINGNFKFSGMFFDDTAKMVLRAKKADKGDNVVVHVTPPDVLPVTKSAAVPASSTIPLAVIAMMRNMYGQKRAFMTSGIVLKQVNIKANTHKNRDSLLSHSDNKNGAGQADAIIIAKDWNVYTRLEDAIQAVIPGAYFINNVMYDLHSQVELTSGSRPPMALIVDGVLIGTDPNAGLTTKDPRNGRMESVFDMINPADVYSIEVLESDRLLNLYGTKASGGAVVITTKTGGEHFTTANRALGLITYLYKGFYKAREFYSPKYEPLHAIKHPDLRTTIFWKPDMVTSKDGEATFNFYNGYGHGSCRVVVEGIDGNGNIGRAVYRYNVE